MIDGVLSDIPKLQAFVSLSTAITAICSLIVAVAALAATIANMAAQRKHNRLSVKPIPVLEYELHDSRLEIAIQNAGHGVLIIKKIFLISQNDIPEDLAEHFRSWGSKGGGWSLGSITGGEGSIRPGASFTLLSVKTNGQGEDTDKLIDELTKELSKYSVSVYFTDIYGSKFPWLTEDLAHFDSID